MSREKFRIQVRTEFEKIGLDLDEEKINKVAEMRVREEINRGVQMIQYQVITLMTTNGQAPFITVFMYLDEVPEGQTRDDLAAIIEEMLHQRIKGVKNEKGVFITPAFPKLIYVLEEDNIHEDSKYFYLTRLAAQCTAKRMVPDYISEKKMKELKVDKNGEGHCYPCMGCRSFLTPYIDPETGKPKYYGRFNQGVVTINLVDVACSSGKDEKKFWKILDERLKLCYRALMCRHKRLLGTPSDVGSDSVAERSACPSEKGRDDRQTFIWRLFHHLFGICGIVRVYPLYDRCFPYGAGDRNTICTACHAASE